MHRVLDVEDGEVQVLGGEATQPRLEGSGHIERRWWALVPGMAIGHGCPGAVLEEKPFKTKTYYVMPLKENNVYIYIICVSV